MKTISVAILLAILCSCNHGNEERKDSAPTFNLSEPPPIQGKSGYKEAHQETLANGNVASDADENVAAGADEKVESNTPVNKQKIIKNGTLGLKSKDLPNAKKNMDGLLKKFNAYYESENYHTSTAALTYDLKIRIPTVNFEKFVAAIETGSEEITGKNIQAQDVSEEYVDLETRLNNKREYLKRYKEILSRASTIKDILALEENIRVLQEEIESKEGRLRYLNDQVAYSSLDINLFQQIEYTYKPVPEDKFSERLKNAWHNGWTGIVEFTLFLIRIWPMVIVLTIASFLLRRNLKKGAKA